MFNIFLYHILNMNKFYVNFILIIYILIFIFILYYDPYEYFYINEEFTNTQIVKPQSKIGLITIMRKPIDLSLWLKYHRNLGITKFFFRVEDTPELEDYLKNQQDVWFEMSESDKKGNNYETLLQRHTIFIAKILKVSKEYNIDFLFNVDVDELLHGSLLFLDNLDKKYNCLVIQNAEAVYNENETSCFSATKFLKCGNGAPCRAYANGKSGARVVDGVHSGGPHRFNYNNSNSGDNVYNVPFNDLKILHFEACSLGSWFEKFYHLSKNQKNNIPFSYYKDSINASKKAYETYKKHTMDYANNISQDLLFIKDSNIP